MVIQLSSGMVRLTACAKTAMIRINKELNSVVVFVCYLMLMAGLLR